MTQLHLFLLLFIGIYLYLLGLRLDAHHQLPIEVLLDLNLPHLFMRVEAVASHQGGCALPEARARRVIHRLIRIIRSMISHLHLLNSLT